MMLPVLLAAMTFSSTCLALLCRGDPKRRRNARLASIGQGKMARPLLAMVMVVPGLYYALMGDGAAFLIWLGGCTILGWGITLLLARYERLLG